MSGRDRHTHRGKVFLRNNTDGKGYVWSGSTVNNPRRPWRAPGRAATTTDLVDRDLARRPA